ncbi:hypothetical protein V6B33_09455 [Mangrovibacillus sp. Mu-81]|jgi:hypothetical protein|uniref:hypothetical protein n=1 Tax=Mangrovibacillus sp. Mu-81 TaxID=3121478 RepID=UPI002FE4D88C
MSLKAIEMQIALPRTFDAAKQAEQHNGNHQLTQSAASLELERELRKKRHTVQESEQKGEVAIHKEKAKDAAEERHKNDDNPEDRDQHPYKGGKIDFKG